jgi:C-terminal processing protease CtpA/Prc
MRFGNIIKTTLPIIAYLLYFSGNIANSLYFCPQSISAILYGRISNEIGHIGISWDCISTIVKVHKDSPASLVGLQKGDKIIKVDGMKPRGGDIEGPPESFVTLTIKRRLPDRTYVLLTFKVQRVPKSQINTND